MSSVGMSPVEYPKLYKVADALSMAGQRRYLMLVGGELVLTCLAALSSDLIHLVPFTRILAACTLAFLLVAFSIEVARLKGVVNWSRFWVEGRAVAESVKTVTWQYMMRVPPFGGTEGVEDEFVERLSRLIPARSLRQLRAGPGNEEITEYMRQQRAGDWETRRTFYLRARIDDQIGWYRRKAALNSRCARLSSPSN
jgi:hypothetical protein